MNGLIIELSPEQLEYVDGTVAKGRYASPSAFIASLINDAQIREEHERIEQLLLEAENEPGEDIPDSPEFWAKLRDEIKQVISSE